MVLEEGLVSLWICGQIGKKLMLQALLLSVEKENKTLMSNGNPD